MDSNVNIKILSKLEKRKLLIEEKIKKIDKKKMKEPFIKHYGPYTKKNLIPGKIYLYCKCGLSKTDPFCDGSHKGTIFKPLKFSLKQKQTIVSICGCRNNCESVI